MPAPHAFYSKMLAERTASRNVFVLFYFILCTFDVGSWGLQAEGTMLSVPG